MYNKAFNFEYGEPDTPSDQKANLVDGVEKVREDVAKAYKAITKAIGRIAEMRENAGSVNAIEDLCKAAQAHEMARALLFDLMGQLREFAEEL